MKTSVSLSEIEKAFREGNLSLTDSLLDRFLGEKNKDYWMLKAGIYQKKQLWGQALNAYQKVLDLDPENTEAKINVEIINNILNFWNPEMLNA